MTDDSRDGLERFWGAQLKWWHLTFAALWAITVVITLLEPAGHGGHVAEVSLLAVIAGAYAVWAPPALADACWQGVAYTVVVWSALVAIHVLDPSAEAWLLFFVLFPHLWVMLPQRWAVVATVVVVGATSAARVWGVGASSVDLTPVIVTALISVALSVLLGLFTTRIVDEASRRAETIDELRAAQADLVAAERDRGVLEERERLSREIHDTLAQGFTSVLTLSRAADAALARGDIVTARERLALVDATARDNLSEARLIIAELSPGHLQSRTLVEALGRLVTAVGAESRVRCALTVEGDPVPLGGDGEVVVLRTAQEGLANVRRHAGATRCSVTADYRDPAKVVLTLADDGRGFDPSVARSGYGLDGLRARAAEVGGTLDVTSAAGEGTRLTLEVPR